MFEFTRRLRKKKSLKIIGIIGILGSIDVLQDTPYAFQMSPLIRDAEANTAATTKDFMTDKAAFKSVAQHVTQKQYTRAQAQAKKIQNSLMRDIALWMIYSNDGATRDFEALAKFTDEPLNWPRQAKLTRNAEKVLPDSFSDQQILTWFKDKAPRSYYGLTRYTSSLKATGQNEKLESTVKNFWIQQYLGKTDEKKFINQYKSLITTQDHIDRLDILIWNKHFVAAQRQLSRVPSDYKNLGKARIALLTGKGNVDGLINRVSTKLKNDPSLIYARARWRLKADRNQETIELLDPPIPTARQAEKWWPIRHWAARKVLVQKDYEKAYRIASGHGLTQGVGFAEGEFLSGWIALRKLSMPRRAYTHFHQLYNGVKSPISKARASYWAGRAAKDIGHDDWATRWYSLAAKYQTTFYGQQANYELGQEPVIHDSTKKIEPVQQGIFNDKKIVRAIKLLDQLDQDKLVITFLTRLRLDAQTDEDHILAAELANKVSHPNIALRTAKSARQKGILLPDLLYPEMQIDTIKDSHADPALVLALIRQESEFNHKAISHAGARGLMQLMPATAKSVAKKEKLSYKKRQLTDDPTYNIQLGTAYLSDLIGSFDGSYVMALAGYNAGPHRVRKWVKDYGDPRHANVNIIDWMEQIPFNETRNYVQRILESHVMYRNKLEQTNTAITGNLPFSLWGHTNSGG
ncbi:lytic transglycosylase domain-containing protein [uncultured Kiloniella sp.]|uniref:lytic transglycosylase domain-containing protein n=1 Tax=uncultured Kiloniella sp. TaxID=1133091 RepID=UPI00260A46DA|nr:lytic transglycosylase domain-containing protein [uncultured Kiloniella sp.]